MELQIGSKISELRKKKGFTQEQLAEQIGVSAPAVSKWETNLSFPDITILCPLARALDTDLDILLSFEKNLSKEQVNEYVGKLLTIKEQQGAQKAICELEELLLRYPGCIDLKFQAVSLYTVFEFDSNLTEEEKQSLKKQKRKFLTEVYESKHPEYFMEAVSALATLEIQEGELNQAEKYLEELPKKVPDATPLWVNYHDKKDEKEKAKDILRKRLLELMVQANTCLIQLLQMEGKDSSSFETIIHAYQKIDELLYGGVGEQDIVLAAIFGKRGEQEKAEDHLKAYLEGHAKEWPKHNRLLFSTALRSEGELAGPNAGVKKLMLQSILEDEILGKLCEKEEIKELLEKWQ